MKHWLTYLAYNAVRLSPFVPLWLRRRAAWWSIDIAWHRLAKQGRVRR